MDLWELVSKAETLYALHINKFLLKLIICLSEKYNPIGLILVHFLS